MLYREALYEGFSKIRTRGLLSINDIIDVQRLLIQNDAGIRNTSGTALVNDRTHEVMYTPPDDYTVINALLKNFVKYRNGDGPTLVIVKDTLPGIYSKELVETLFVNPYCKESFYTHGTYPATEGID